MGFQLNRKSFYNFSISSFNFLFENLLFATWLHQFSCLGTELKYFLPTFIPDKIKTL